MNIKLEKLACWRCIGDGKTPRPTSNHLFDGIENPEDCWVCSGTGLKDYKISEQDLSFIIEALDIAPYWIKAPCEINQKCARALAILVEEKI